jgi:hypothetical protein
MSAFCEEKMDKKANNKYDRRMFFSIVLDPRRNMSEHHKQFSPTQIFRQAQVSRDIEKCCFTLSV